MIELFDKLNKKQLLDLFHNFLLKSSFMIKKEDIKRNTIELEIDDGVINIDLHMMIKNVTNAGWEDKKNIKRIQVGNLNNVIVYTNKKRTFLICGILKNNDKNILVVWNAYRYLNHNTNRSCYVNSDTINECYNKGYCISHDFNQETWLCDEEHFNLLIRDYILFNYMESVGCY